MQEDIFTFTVFNVLVCFVVSIIMSKKDAPGRTSNTHSFMKTFSDRLISFSLKRISVVMHYPLWPFLCLCVCVRARQEQVMTL